MPKPQASPTVRSSPSNEDFQTASKVMSKPQPPPLPSQVEMPARRTDNQAAQVPPPFQSQAPGGPISSAPMFSPEARMVGVSNPELQLQTSEKFYI